MINLFDSTVVESLRRRLALHPHRIQQLRNRLLKRFLPDEEVTREFSDLSELQWHCLHLQQRCDSAVDGASKLLFRTETNELLETVILRIASGRASLCVSSQIGCAAACQFCATGKIPSVRSLTSAQILDQVLQAGQILSGEGRRLRNIVFMGMGEPFHNVRNVFETIELLTDVRHFAWPSSRLTVSTVGIPDPMICCAERFPDVRLALSLHSVEQDVRSRLMPLASRYPLDVLRKTVQEINQLQKSPVMLEYLMLQNCNDQQRHALLLADWTTGLNVHVNLIPFNEIPTALIDGQESLRGSSREVIEAFAQRLKCLGLTVTVRYSLGADITAACGQLARRPP